MKQYGGGWMGAYAGIALLLLTVAPLVFALWLLLSHIGIAEILLSVACVACSALLVWYAVRYWASVYTWYTFEEESVTVKTLFRKPYSVSYDQLPYVGIGCYAHGVLGSKLGTTHHFLYLSKRLPDETVTTHINRVPPSPAFVKAVYTEALYAYLLPRLSKSQALTLEAQRRALKQKNS